MGLADETNIFLCYDGRYPAVFSGTLDGCPGEQHGRGPDNDEAFKDSIVEELKNRGLKLHGVKDEKIVFLAEGESAGEVKARMENLQGIEGVQGVYLTYFSYEQSSPISGRLPRESQPIARG